ncbi:MAG: hypothetical protein HRT44_07415 [Bdellovibrionales bacterium]|nr:hypothetical protein [Bdellovibrionales bacterium]NQZ19066.1 hypothetical protein [Bdellovibrionales bacterium]
MIHLKTKDDVIDMLNQIYLDDLSTLLIEVCETKKELADDLCAQLKRLEIPFIGYHAKKLTGDMKVQEIKTPYRPFIIENHDLSSPTQLEFEHDIHSNCLMISNATQSTNVIGQMSFFKSRLETICDTHILEDTVEVFCHVGSKKNNSLSLKKEIPVRSRAA